MKKHRLTPADETALSNLDSAPPKSVWEASYGDWIRIVRSYLRMTQAELAARAGIPQSHVAGIEGGKIDPRVSTLKRIYEALSCRLSLEPKPMNPLPEVLRGRARSVALKRLKQSTGSMAMEGQAPEADMFRQLLEKQTDAILNDPRERLWNKSYE